MEYIYIHFFHIIIYTPKERKRMHKSEGNEENKANLRYLVSEQKFEPGVLIYSDPNVRFILLL